MPKEISKRIIEVLPYNNHWPKQFAEEAVLIKKALGTNCIETHRQQHLGFIKKMATLRCHLMILMVMKVIHKIPL